MQNNPKSFYFKHLVQVSLVSSLLMWRLLCKKEVKFLESDVSMNFFCLNLDDGFIFY